MRKAIAQRLLKCVGVELDPSGTLRGVTLPTGDPMATVDPTTGEVLAEVPTSTHEEAMAAIGVAAVRFQEWRRRPPPARGALVRALGERVRALQEPLGKLISLEVGKIRTEGAGEVQEMVDMCDLAVGLSRQLHGLTIASERPEHRMLEQWHPLGPVGVITAFNFPVAVWSWNAAVAAVCGDPVVWKPSPAVPLTSLAIHALCRQVEAEHDAVGLFPLVLGGAEAGGWLVDDRRLPLVSFTGSIAAGREVATRVARRLGRSLLELGGNNGVIVLDDADLDLAVRAVVFGAVGTAGQRCTTTRRLFVQRGVADELTARLVRAYRSLEPGDPLKEDTLLGPLASEAAVAAFEGAVAKAGEQGGEVLIGGHRLDRPGFFVAPTIVRAPRVGGLPIAAEETFAPILYVFEVEDLVGALEAHNAVPQGLSSALFSDSLRSVERFLGPAGSDCGIANVNLGTSGAEIGGAFGGEKDTGGGREAGSDAWKAYMRRQTVTINGGRALPLAQGVSFGDADEGAS
ncbi:MAG: aldehyde dehydrogenase family protein [Sandaracinaceae bacterium]